MKTITPEHRDTLATLKLLLEAITAAGAEADASEATWERAEAEVGRASAIACDELAKWGMLKPPTPALRLLRGGAS